MKWVMWMVLSIVFLVAMFLGYHYLIFQLIDNFLKGPKLKKVLRIPVGIVNAIVTIAVVVLSGNMMGIAYIAMGLLLYAEFGMFYKDKCACSLFCALSCAVHIMVLHALSIGVFSFATRSTIYEVANSPFPLVLSTGITFLLLNCAIVLVLKLIPAKSIRIINQHNEQLWFMIAWLCVFSLYMLIDSSIYSTPLHSPTLFANHIIAPLALFIGTYILLFFLIKTGKLLGYKEKSEELQSTMEKERQYHNTIDKNVFRIIEVNFTQGILISGFEDYQEKLGDMVHDYRKMLAFMIEATVHADDREEFIRYLSPLTVVDVFERGASEIVFDYRRLMDDGSYVWMHVIMALMRDTQSNDVKGFVQIKDIDAEKKQHLELQYKAERDLLTGLYNKSTTEALITKQLTSSTGNTISGILFVIDIDNFKTINDRLGHLYGDAVLSDLSESLRKVFRDRDIVGRIGGDEFLVFAEGLQNESLTIQKAQSICGAFLQTYANEKNEGYTVSSSVGIAVFPKDGETFEALFQHADVALYTAKANGKNTYAFYDETSEMAYLPTRTEIDTHGVVQKSFKENRVEYVFRLLYGPEDTKTAIELVLELIAKNFGFSRANIFEFNELSTHFSGVFEWCAIGIDSVSANYTDMPVSSFDFVISALSKSGGMFLAVPEDFPEFARESYTSIGIKSIVHFSIEERDQLMGVIAFQSCTEEEFRLLDTEFEELRTVCQVLSVFMAKRLGHERELRQHKAIQAVMDNMNSISYVIDRETYEVYYENQNTVDITERISIGDKCHSSYRGLEAPCEDCPLAHLSEDKPRVTLELFTEKFQLYTKTSAALLDWSNDRKAMLISSVDVTEYKKERP